MKELIDTKNIFLDSRNKTRGNYYDFSYSLNNGDPFFNCNAGETMTMNLTTFQITNDFYNIKSDNNQFGIGQNTIIDPSANPKDAVKIALTEGYYDVYNMIEELESIVKTELDDGFGESETYVFTVNIQYITSTSKLKWTITATGNYFDTYTMFFLFKDTTTDAGDLELTGVPLQFLGYSSVDDEPAVSDSELNSNIPINMVLQPTIFIKSNLVKDNKEFFNNGSTQLLKASNTLCIIDIVVPKLSSIQYTDYNNNFETQSIRSINEIDFRFVDEDNNIIDFRSDNRISLKFSKYKENHEIVDNIKKITELKESELLFNQMTTLMETKEAIKDYEVIGDQEKELDDLQKQGEQLLNEE